MSGWSAAPAPGSLSPVPAAGQTGAARGVLFDALSSARNRGFEYDIAATIDALCALCGPNPELLHERDEILDRLKIARLVAPAPALGATPAPAAAPTSEAAEPSTPAPAPAAAPTSEAAEPSTPAPA